MEKKKGEEDKRQAWNETLTWNSRLLSAFLTRETDVFLFFFFIHLIFINAATDIASSSSFQEVV